MKKIVLVLLFMCSFAFASEDFIFVVENTAMVDAYFNIFNAISALFSNDDYIDLLRLVFLLGGFFTFANSVLNSYDTGGTFLAPYAKYIIVGTSLLVLMGGKATMFITTNNLPSYCSTGTSMTTGTAVEMPSILAYTFTTINSIGRNGTQLAEAAYYTPSVYGTPSMSDSNGFGGSIKESIKLLSLNPNEVSLNNDLGTNFNFSKDWGRFFSQCVFEVTQNKGKEGEDKINELSKSKNIYTWAKDFLDYKFNGYSQSVGDIHTVNVSGVDTDCRTYFNYLDTVTQTYLNSYACAAPLSNGGVLELLTGSTTGGISQLNEIALQSGIIASVEAVSKDYNVGIAGSDYATGKTRAEFTLSNQAAGAYMAQMLPYMQMTLRAVLYGFFPFLFAVALLPGGIRVLTQYGQTLLWVELWSPTAAVLNLFTNTQYKSDIGNKFTDEGLTIMNSYSYLSDSATIAGVAGYLYLSVPALTWLILKGSGHMLGSISAGVTAKFAQNLTSDSQARDLNQAKAAKASNTSVTNMINSIEASSVANSASDAMAFNKVGMDKTVSTKGTLGTAQRLGEIEKITSQGGSKEYVSTQIAKAGLDAVTEKADTDAKVDAGGKEVVRDNTEIKTSTELETTKKEINLSGGNKKNVVDTKSTSNANSYNSQKAVVENTTSKDHYNTGLNDAANKRATSTNVDKHGDKKIEENIKNKMNEDIIKTDTRFNEIEKKHNKDDFAKQQAKQDFNVKENVEYGKHDYNGDGRTDDKEIAKGAKQADVKAKSDVLAEEVRQEELKKQGKKLLGANSKKANEAKQKANEVQNVDKDIARAVAFGSSAKLETETFNQEKDVTNIEQLEGNGYTADDMGNKDASNNMNQLEKMDTESNNMTKDLEVVNGQAKETVAELKAKGYSDAEANKIVMNDMDKRNLHDKDIIAASYGNDIGRVEAQREKALKSTGLNAESYAGSKKAIAHLEKQANNKNLTEAQRAIFTQNAQGLKDKIKDYEKINSQYDKKVNAVNNEYTNRGLVNITKNGQVQFRDTVATLKNASKEDRNQLIGQIKGASEGQKTSFVDLKGMDTQKIKDVLGNNTTDVARATQEWSKTARFNNDITFHAVKEGYVAGETMANINKGLEIGRNLATSVPAGKMLVSGTKTLINKLPKAAPKISNADKFRNQYLSNK